MSAAIEFVWDSRDLEVWRGGKVEGALVRALRLAGNQALRGMQKGSVEHVIQRKRMKPDEVTKGLPLVFPSRKEALRDLVWREKVSGSPVPLAKFPHIQTARGVSVRVNVGGATKRIKSAFVATMRNGHQGVFRRKGKERLPIQELWTTRLSDVMKDAGAIPSIQSKAYAKMQGAFERGLTRELQKLVRKGEA
jgi:hypothetical protein